MKTRKATLLYGDTPDNSDVNDFAVFAAKLFRGLFPNASVIFDFKESAGDHFLVMKLSSNPKSDRPSYDQAPDPLEFTVNLGPFNEFGNEIPDTVLAFGGRNITLPPKVRSRLLGDVGNTGDMIYTFKAAMGLASDYVLAHPRGLARKSSLITTAKVNPRLLETYQDYSSVNNHWLALATLAKMVGDSKLEKAMVYGRKIQDLFGGTPAHLGDFRGFYAKLLFDKAKSIKVSSNQTLYDILFE